MGLAIASVRNKHYSLVKATCYVFYSFKEWAFRFVEYRLLLPIYFWADGECERRSRAPELSIKLLLRIHQIANSMSTSRGGSADSVG